MKPSKLINVSPMGSIARKSEAETVARNIIIILSRTGDEWRKLSWEEYRQERIEKGRGFSEREQPYFEQVVDYTVSEQTARLFSPGWKEAAEKDGSQ